MRIYGPNGSTLGAPAASARRAGASAFALPDTPAAPEKTLTCQLRAVAATAETIIDGKRCKRRGRFSVRDRAAIAGIKPVRRITRPSAGDRSRHRRGGAGAPGPMAGVVRDWRHRHNPHACDACGGRHSAHILLWSACQRPQTHAAGAGLAA